MSLRPSIRGTDFALLLVAASALVFGTGASLALATHDHPAHADSFHVELVPLHRETISTTQCSARGGAPSTHGTPLAFESCNPPAFLPGLRAHLGAQATSTLDVEVLEGDGDPSNGDAADFTINGTVTDVRDASATGPDYNPVASPGAADMTLVWNVRISDDLNTTPSDPCSPSCPATVIDFDFPAVGNVSCAATGDFTIGSTCTISATGDSFIPDLVKEGRKMVFQFDRARLIDAGSDGIPGNANDEDAFTQGFYVP